MDISRLHTLKEYRSSLDEIVSCGGTQTENFTFLIFYIWFFPTHKLSLCHCIFFTIHIDICAGNDSLKARNTTGTHFGIDDPKSCLFIEEINSLFFYPCGHLDLVSLIHEGYFFDRTYRYISVSYLTLSGFEPLIFLKGDLYQWSEFCIVRIRKPQCYQECGYGDKPYRKRYFESFGLFYIRYIRHNYCSTINAILKLCAAISVKNTERAKALDAVPAMISTLEKCIRPAIIATTNKSIMDHGPISSVI